jgi:hypothetical protein
MNRGRVRLHPAAISNSHKARHVSERTCTGWPCPKLIQNMVVMTDIVYDIYKTFREFALLPYRQGCSGWCQAWNCLYKTTTLPLMEHKSIKQLSDNKSPEEGSSVNSRKGVLIRSIHPMALHPKSGLGLLL